MFVRLESLCTFVELKKFFKRKDWEIAQNSVIYTISIKMLTLNDYKKKKKPN